MLLLFSSLIMNHNFLIGVPSAYQQKRIKELNSTLHREQLEVMQTKDRMIMVTNPQVLRKPINANSGLKVNQSINFS